MSESKVLCTAPAGVGTHLPVAIRTQDFPEAVTFGSLVFEYDPPVVTAISKSHGSIAGGLGITVTGYGFGMADTIVGVKVGESRCEQDSWISDSSLLCTTPAGQVVYAYIYMHVCVCVCVCMCARAFRYVCTSECIYIFDWSLNCTIPAGQDVYAYTHVCV